MQNDFPEGFLVVSRIPDPRNPVRHYDEPYTPEWVSHRYRGVEGEPWPLNSRDHANLDEYELADTPTGLDEAIERLANSDPSIRADVIAIAMPSSLRPPWVPADFQLHGYDYCHALDIEFRCSLLYNEVIFGLLPDLARFRMSLNESLLLPNLDMVQKVDREREAQQEKSADTETLDEEDFASAVAVYAR